MQNGIESSSEAKNYELFLGDGYTFGNTFWKLPKPTRADPIDFDYLLFKFVRADGLSKTELMQKIRNIIKA